MNEGSRLVRREGERGVKQGQVRGGKDAVGGEGKQPHRTGKKRSPSRGENV